MMKNKVWALIFILVIGSNGSFSKNISRNDNNVIVTPDGEVRMDSVGDFVTFKSSYYALSWYKSFPMMSFWGVESGGRNHHYMERSLLRSGQGGTLVCGTESSFGKSAPLSMDEKGISYQPLSFTSGERACNFQILSTRSFRIHITSSNRGLKGEFFKINTAPDVSPVSVWSEKLNVAPSCEYDKPVTIYTPKIVKASLRLPSVFTFPDYGNVRVEADNPNVYLQEHFLPDASNTGLPLGPYNRNGHNWRVSLHLGSVVLSFHSLQPLDSVNLTFTVLDENYPHMDGCDFSNPRFNGLKRCWQNNFTLNPETMTMGDNIALDGIGHISLYFKADLLPFTPPLPSSFSMTDALKQSIEQALLYCIGEDNRIEGFGYEGTESTLIATYDYLLATRDWPFIKKYLPQYLRLVQGVLDTDQDHDGIFEDPFSGNHYGGTMESCIWWDDFAFGYKDAYRNLLAYRALGLMKEIFVKLKKYDESQMIENRLQMFQKAFHHTFYNPKTGFYAGWISKDGRVHDYAFTFVSATAIYLNLVPQTLARKILNKMLGMMGKEGFDFIYGIPGPLIPVAKEDKLDWDEMARWGRYENGGLCGQTAYHFIQALYHVGMKKEADKILFTMLNTFERDYTHSGLMPGYQKSIDWRTKGGEPTGYNYLADNYYFLLAAITGYYHVPYPKLTDPN
jgi:hypothetical protein